MPIAELPPRNEEGHLLCSYCMKKAEFFRDSSSFYRGRDYGPLWACQTCKAWVGCHPGSKKPLGRLANKNLRMLKMKTHGVFDPLWKFKIKKQNVSKNSSRSMAYTWLAGQLEISTDVCHIGMMNEAMCQKVINICKPYFEKLIKNREVSQ